MENIEIFIAGAKDLTVQRDSATAALMRVSNKFRNANVTFRVYSFEDFDRSFTGDSEGRQGDYNRYIAKKADYVICIFDKTIGEISLDELRLACKSLEERKKPGVYVYCNEKNILADKRFKELLSLVREKHQYYITYRDGHLRDAVYNDFIDVCLGRMFAQGYDEYVDARSNSEYKVETVKELWNALSASTKSMFFMVKTASESGLGFKALVEQNNALVRALRKAGQVLPADIHEQVMAFAKDVPEKGFNWVVDEFRRYADTGLETLDAAALQKMHDTLIRDIVNVDMAQERINGIQKLLTDYCNNVLLRG